MYSTANNRKQTCAQTTGRKEEGQGQEVRGERVTKKKKKKRRPGGKSAPSFLPSGYLVFTPSVSLDSSPVLQRYPPTFTCLSAPPSTCLSTAAPLPFYPSIYPSFSLFNSLIPFLHSSVCLSLHFISVYLSVTSPPTSCLSTCQSYTRHLFTLLLRLLSVTPSFTQH